MNTVQELQAARDRIRYRGDWFGLDESLRGPDSMQRCALLACKSEAHLTDALREALVRMGESPTLIHFNETHTHAEVLELFNIAIANELAREKQPKVRMATYTGELDPVAA